MSHRCLELLGIQMFGTLENSLNPVLPYSREGNTLYFWALNNKREDLICKKSRNQRKLICCVKSLDTSLIIKYRILENK